MEFSSSEQNIGWFRDRYLEGTLVIKPPYQRKPVWQARQKCYLIESILMGLPIPEIYIQQTVSPEERTIYSIVDGQQRMRAILQFIGSESDPDEEEHNKFSLDKLDASSEWINRGYSDLSESARKKFIGHRLSVRYLNTDSEEEIREMFRRLNKFLTPLKPQELRNATYSGPFVRLVLKFADSEYWAENKIVTAESIRRMGDVEFVSELVVGLKHGPQGGSAQIIDSYFAQYEDFEDEFPSQKQVGKLFEETLRTVQELLPEIKSTRWSNKTDFYSLFVCIGTLLRDSKVDNGKAAELSKRITGFGESVDRRQHDEKTKVPNHIVKYVNAIVRGANDKSRRAERHESLIEAVSPFFISRR